MHERLRIYPSRQDFERLASTWPLVPVWTELLADVVTPVGLFPALAGDGPGIVLESVERSERWGRYSFVAGDPAAVLVVDGSGARLEEVARPLPVRPRAGDPRSALIEFAQALRGPRLTDLPPLTGGLMGCLSFEAATLLDGHPAPRAEAAPCPPITLLVVDRAVVFDHWRQRMVPVVHAGSGGYDHAVSAVHELVEHIARPGSLSPAPMTGTGGGTPAAEEANMGDARYREIVASFKEHILAGDIYQGVPSRRIAFPAREGGFPIYRRLRVTNPAPYMFFVRLGGSSAVPLELAGSSPEPLVRVEGRRVTARPIAGTRERGRTDVRDRLLEHELLADPKERAEHAMLVDLARNDLGRVCIAGSVHATELMAVERFSKVMHIVSTVEGELREGVHPLEALAVAFPAGTVTGAPKRRAMELIAEQEPTPRGPYAGAVGYLTFAGDLDFCITIRTVVVTEGLATIQTGAGVVADSDPETELRETQAKAAALIPAVTGTMEPRP